MTSKYSANPHGRMLIFSEDSAGSFYRPNFINGLPRQLSVELFRYVSSSPCIACIFKSSICRAPLSAPDEVLIRTRLELSIAAARYRGRDELSDGLARFYVNSANGCSGTTIRRHVISLC